MFLLRFFRVEAAERVVETVPGGTFFGCRWRDDSNKHRGLRRSRFFGVSWGGIGVANSFDNGYFLCYNASLIPMG